MRFACPRCQVDVDGELYGPCPTCRQALRAAFTGEQREVVAADYEPKANVTPNAVATKD